MTAEAPAPFAGTCERLRRRDEYLCRAEIARPHGPGWLGLDVDAGVLVDSLFAAAQRDGHRRLDYIGASVAAGLIDVLVSTAVPALLVERRLPDVTPTNLTVHLHDSEFWFDRIALHEPMCWALSNDAAIGHPTLIAVAAVDELHRRFAAVMAETAAAWFDAVRSRAPFGRAGMWGQLADDVCGSALWTARAVGLDQHGAWEEARAIIDVVAAAVPELRVRPRLFPVRWSGGETLWQVKGTCCLWYTTFAEPDTCGDGYCNTCPLRPDEIRHARLAEWLEAEAANAG